MIILVIFGVGVDIFDHHLAEVHCSEEQSPLLYSAVRERQHRRGGEGGQATIIYRGKHFAQNFPLKADKLGSFQAKGEKIICRTATTCRKKLTWPQKMTRSVKMTWAAKNEMDGEKMTWRAKTSVYKSTVSEDQ